MAIEFWMLLVVTGLYFALVMVEAASVTASAGVAYNMSNRDAPIERTVFSNRAGRAVRNHLEGLVFFAPLVVVAQGAGALGGLTATAAVAYALCRVAHAATYLSGVALARSLSWMAGIAALIVMVGAIIARA